MVKALPKELRERIVNAYERAIGTIEEIALLFNTSSRTVARYLSIKRKTGDLTPKVPPGRPPILNEENLSIIKSIYLSNKDGTLQDYCDEFKERTGIKTTLVTLHNACKRLDIRRKKRVTMPKKEIG
jgi:transposase